MTLHKKQLGNLGEMTIAADLISKGYEVFTELGDNSKVDLIALDEDFKPWKIQVKCLSVKNNVVTLNRTKSGPNYRFRYQRKHADIYAVYIYELDMICYVPATLLMQNSKSLTIRTNQTENNQQSGINLASDFSSFEKALRDCMCDTPPT